MAEIRSLASGLYPSLLLERGLVEALSEVAAACPVPTTLTAESMGRYAPEIEGAVYFCCREALQNAAKHAQGAASVVVKLWEADAKAVHFEVRDDGAGLPQGDGGKGVGITNMRDRIGAMGGTLAIESHPGAGTCVAGAVPMAPVDVPLPIDSLLRRATDALPDCFAVYRAVTDARGNVADFAVEHMNDAARRELGVGARNPWGKPSGSCSLTTCGRKPSGGFDTSSSWRCRVGGRTRRTSPSKEIAGVSSAVLGTARRPPGRGEGRGGLEGCDRARARGRGAAAPIDGAASSG